MSETTQVPVSGEVQQKVCPILSVATIRPAQSNLLVGPTGLGTAPRSEGLEFAPCVRGACEMWTDIHDDKGQSIGGRCALALFPNAVNSIAQTMLAIATPPASQLNGAPRMGTINPIRKK